MGFNFAQDLASDSVLSSYQEGSEATISVRVIDCLYRNKETGFGVYLVENENRRRFKIIGIFASQLRINYYYEVTGTVIKREGEWQLDVKQYQSTFPQDQEGVLTVLRTLSGLNTQANVVYKRLGNQALKIIHDSPEKVVRCVPGVSLKRAKVWQEQLSATDMVEMSIAVLKAMGLSIQKAKRLIDEFGTDVGEQIKNDPYFLMSKAGILSFSDCDKIALSHGGDLTNPTRIAAAMLHVLKSEAHLKGNCYLGKDEFLDTVRQLTGLHLKYKDAQTLLKQVRAPIYRWSQYGSMCEVNIEQLAKAVSDWKHKKKRPSFKYFVFIVPDDALERGLQMALEQKAIIQDELDGSEVFMQNMIYQAEISVAASIRNIQNADLPFISENTGIIDAYCRENGIYLEERQREAVEKFTKTRGGFHVLCGPAGCGKTFTLNVILNVLKKIYQASNEPFSALVLAPTGKAAKVASESTSLPAFTIHKALGLVGDEENPFHFTQIQANCVVIDEFSMVDIFLAQKLLSNIPPMTKVIIMGDSSQLPSIGPGMVLKDIIASGKVQTVTLDVVKRQGALSGVLLNANRILNGQPIKTQQDQGSESGAFVYHVDTPVQCREKLVDAYLQQLEAGRTISDVQILCPQKMTEVGTDVLNYIIQQRLLAGKGMENAVPAKTISYEDFSSGETKSAVLCFCKGDKVIHTENDYNAVWYKPSPSGKLIKDLSKKGIINGEMGFVFKTMVAVKDGNMTSCQVLVKYDEGYVLYQDEDIQKLQHAYAMTIHKSQGSQWPVIIAPTMMCNYGMLSRNLFYTLYTRAQQSTIVFGQEAAIQRAIDNDAPASRKTGLSFRI